MDKTLFLRAIIAGIFLLTSCATGEDYISSNKGSNYNEVFYAAISAAEDIGFSVIEEDADSGAIVVGKIYGTSVEVKNEGLINVLINEIPRGVSVEVISYLNGEKSKNILKKYVRALKKSVPSRLTYMPGQKLLTNK